MPKLASTLSSSPSLSLRVIRIRLRSHPHSPSIASSRCASSQVRPLASELHHDISRCRLPQATVPLRHSGPGPTLKYSPTDDLTPQNKGDHKPPDERILKLGKTLRTLSPLLPTILTNALPPHILSPSVTLHLFPSTHPHLPTVKGRTLYRAALWAVPVAWSSVPLVGNVKLQILSERIVRAGTVLDSYSHAPASQGESPYEQSEGGDERLVVRWRTEHTHTHSNPSSSSSSVPDFKSTPPSTTSTHTKQDSDSRTGTNKGLSVLLGGDAPIFKLSSEQQFTGLFIFSFDEEGRVLTQTIEHAEDASGWERTAKFVTLTDWLIGKARGSLETGEAPAPGLAGCSSHGRHEHGLGHREFGHEAGRWRRC